MNHFDNERIKTNKKQEPDSLFADSHLTLLLYLVQATLRTLGLLDEL